MANAGHYARFYATEDDDDDDVFGLEGVKCPGNYRALESDDDDDNNSGGNCGKDAAGDGRYAPLILEEVARLVDVDDDDLISSYHTDAETEDAATYNIPGIQVGVFCFRGKEKCLLFYLD